MVIITATIFLTYLAVVVFCKLVNFRFNNELSECCYCSLVGKVDFAAHIACILTF